MDVRRIRPLFLPPRPRRNRYTPTTSEEGNSIPLPRFCISAGKAPYPLPPSSFPIRSAEASDRVENENGIRLPLQLEPTALGFKLVKNGRTAVFFFLTNTDPKLHIHCLLLPYQHRPACAGLCVGETIENVSENFGKVKRKIYFHSSLSTFHFRFIP